MTEKEKVAFAKGIIAGKHNLTEGEAHYRLLKTAMKRGITKLELAEKLIRKQESFIMVLLVLA